MTRIMSGSDALSIVFLLFIKNLAIYFQSEQSVSIQLYVCSFPAMRFRIASVSCATWENSSHSSFSPRRTSLITT